MTYKDYYRELGIGATATPAEIKKAYRALANKYHPDKSKGDKTAEEKFKAINEANEVLSDPVKRKKYDQFGADWKNYEAGGAQPGGFDWSKYASGHGGQAHRSGTHESDAMFTDENVNDLFEMLFGYHSGQRQGRRSVVRKGEDLRTETTLSLEEAYRGTTRLIHLDGQTIRVTINPGVADHANAKNCRQRGDRSRRRSTRGPLSHRQNSAAPGIPPAGERSPRCPPR